ncbi:4'-phosphopantetheinyl transferase family protein [Limosilactobacillus reuteri]|uniref:4'-phosphopantetheinyl transferase family protein n=1 Tax=Limosilactobacillus reuteri TaxID=1598 RepID=UPI00128E5CC9|nr:hypothetical protein [Limosilactobacillus reuteri]MQB77747.1 hypothetical protein [Limosilactobacillus reuteri]MQB99802.1 hypothetical protein [Limosilactobacillus reuteri]
MYIYIKNNKHINTNSFIIKKLTELGYSNILIKENKYGKKYVENNVFFNISHSSSLLALAINNDKIGIDCECKSTNLFLPELKYILNSSFFNVLDFYSKDHFGLIKFWTILEAFIKCVGFGFCKELDYFTINPRTNTIYNYLDNEIYNFSTFEYQKNYVTICTKSPLDKYTLLLN